MCGSGCGSWFRCSAQDYGYFTVCVWFLCTSRTKWRKGLSSNVQLLPREANWKRAAGRTEKCGDALRTHSSSFASHGVAPSPAPARAPLSAFAPFLPRSFTEVETHRICHKRRSTQSTLQQFIRWNPISQTHNHPAQKSVSASRQSALPRSALRSMVLASFIPVVLRNLLRPRASHISVKPVPS